VVYYNQGKGMRELGISLLQTKGVLDGISVLAFYRPKAIPDGITLLQTKELPFL
jgi:hypothetical protein